MSLRIEAETGVLWSTWLEPDSRLQQLTTPRHKSAYKRLGCCGDHGANPMRDHLLASQNRYHQPYVTASISKYRP